MANIYGIDDSEGSAPLYSQMYGIAPTEADQEQMIRDERIKKLAAAKLSKQARLGFNVDKSLQQNLSDAIDAQIYTRTDGSLYTIDYQPTVDAYGQPTVNPVEVDYTDTNRFGADVRDLYIDDTAQGNMKLGLARTDQGGYKGRYDPLLHPEWEKAINDRLAGPKGVTPNDGALMNITLPADYATAFEYGVHSDVDQIRNRAMGLGPKTAETQQQYGSGQTEYTTPNAPMWNADYIRESNVPHVGLDTPMPSDPKYYAKTTPQKEEYVPGADGMQIGEALAAGAMNVTGRLAEGLGEGMEQGANLLELPGKAVKSFGEWQEKYNLKNPPIKGDKVSETIGKWQQAFAQGAKDLGGWMNKDNILADTLREEGAQIQREQQDYRTKNKWNDLAGYNPKDVQKYGEEFADSVEKGNYVKAMVDLVDPRAVTAFVNSAPEMLAMANPWGLGAIMASNANKNLNDLYTKAEKDGQEVTKGNVSASIAMSIVGTYLDRIGDKAVLSTGRELKALISNMPTAVKNRVLKAYATPLKAVGITAITVAGKIGIEGGTEGAQTLLEGKASDVTKQNLNITKEEGREALEATGVGMGAGGVPVAATTAKDSLRGLNNKIDSHAKEMLSKKIEKYAKTEEVKKAAKIAEEVPTVSADVNDIEDFSVKMEKEELQPYIETMAEKQASGDTEYTAKEQQFIANYGKEINEFYESKKVEDPQ